MHHDWIFDVLEDLRSYAQANGLSGVALQAEIALQIARVEIAARGESPAEEPPPERGRGH